MGDGEKMPTALVQPDFAYAKKWLQEQGITGGDSPENIIKQDALKEAIKQDINEMNKHLGSWEQIKLFEMTPEVWSVDNGLLTPTLKLKRKAIKERYIDLYNAIYGHDHDH